MWMEYIYRGSKHNTNNSYHSKRYALQELNTESK